MRSIRIQVTISARTLSLTSLNKAARWRTNSAVPAFGPATILALIGGAWERGTHIGLRISISQTFCRDSTCTTAHGRSGLTPESRHQRNLFLIKKALAGRRGEPPPSA